MRDSEMQNVLKNSGLGGHHHHHQEQSAHAAVAAAMRLFSKKIREIIFENCCLQIIIYTGYPHKIHP